ncbi:hypothetical protein [Paludisphaera mucosa]|uniref:Uncharacterized protein n=1 Tax=Paludisphaera mucosa TaxID=3030827 RepID=A0ABT6FG61_9BACT|nr:hypothetical protein [Paludisphaera mucosa]MDG3006567.1 hypothetical protein [Paludisphaera mucosa]
MRLRTSQAFRPCGEMVERRLLTAALPPMRAAAAERALHRQRPVNPALRPPLRRTPGVTVPGPAGPTTTIGAGFLGNQGPAINRPTIPAANVSYGLVTITNTTQATIAFSVSASTYQGGKFYDFTLNPGKSEVFYAPFGGPFNSAPTFQVSFDTAERRSAIQLAEVDTVYAPARWTPTDVSQGRPYAIVAEFGALNVVPVS